MTGRLSPVGTLATMAALMLGSGCTGATDVPEERHRLGERSTFDVMLVVDSAIQAHWLRAGDSVSVQLRIEPDESAERVGTIEGIMRYSGVPVWYPARGDSAAFQTSYFTHSELGAHLIGVFWGANVGQSRLVLIFDPSRLALQWSVTANDASGDLIEIASGTGHRAYLSSP